MLKFVGTEEVYPLQAAAKIMMKKRKVYGLPLLDYLFICSSIRLGLNFVLANEPMELWCAGLRLFFFYSNSRITDAEKLK